MSNEVMVAVLTAVGAIAGAIAAVYTTRRTARAAEKADEHDREFEADRTYIEGFKELADENRKDRRELRERLEAVEREVQGLRQHIERVEAEKVELVKERTLLVRYIHRLREFVRSLGSVPPDPHPPVDYDW